METSSDDRLAAYIDASIAFQNLPVSAEWRPAIAAHLAAISDAARLVFSSPLDELIEAAPMFQP